MKPAPPVMRTFIIYFNIYFKALSKLTNFIVFWFPKPSKTWVVAKEDKNKDIFGSLGNAIFIILNIAIKESPEPILSITFFAKAGQWKKLFL